MRIQEQAHSGTEFRLSKIGWHSRERSSSSHANGTAQHLLCYFRNGGQACTASSENASCAQGLQDSCLAQVVAHHLKQFPRARLQDLRDQSLRHHSRWPLCNRRNLDLVAFRNRGHHGASKELLDLLRFLDRSAESNCDVIGEMISTDG